MAVLLVLLVSLVCFPLTWLRLDYRTKDKVNKSTRTCKQPLLLDFPVVLALVYGPILPYCAIMKALGAYHLIFKALCSHSLADSERVMYLAPGGSFTLISVVNLIRWRNSCVLFWLLLSLASEETCKILIGIKPWGQFIFCVRMSMTIL